MRGTLNLLDGKQIEEPKHSRLLSLDALRGLAIIAMLFSGVIPWDGLPAWMYHCQEPPPSHDLNPNVTGITWVDLVFPFFLFSMGAAIPLAELNREARNRLYWILPTVRGMLLIAFAIFSKHLRPEALSDHPGRPEYLICLLGFLLALGMFGRFPSGWPLAVKVALKVAGWLGAAVLLRQLRFADTSMPRFSLDRSDVIILVLAVVSVAGTYAWRGTRDSFEARAAIIALLVAFRTSVTVSGSWQEALWNTNPIPWMFHTDYIIHVIVVLAGSFCGDLLGRQDGEKQGAGWLAVACFALQPIAIWVFFTQANPMIAVACGLCIFGLGWWRHPTGPIRSILAMGLLWLTLGCLLEPFQGGIRKYPNTLSYLFVTSGLAAFALLIFQCLPPKSIGWLAAVGKNPLLAYQTITSLIPALSGLVLAALFDRFTKDVAGGLAAAGLKVVLLIVIVAGFSKLNISMRV